MKRQLLIGLAVAAALTACGGDGDGNGSTDSATSASTSSTITRSTPTTSTPTTPTATDTTTAVTTSPDGMATTDQAPTPEATPVTKAQALPTATQTAVPPPTAAQQLPAGVNTSTPGVAVKPQAVTASSYKGNNTPTDAADGNPATRWESNYDDAEWIQFDFGAKTELGSMKITWQNAYASEFSIQVSDDAQTWYQLRYITNATGGTQEFMNLDSEVRYVRINGIKRETQYGYSIYEVAFESPGSDNTLGANVTPSAIPFPVNGSQLAPPAPTVAPLEGLQFTLPDGTLVTRWGTVGRHRHGRERGESWDEVGDPNATNDTVDAAGDPEDQGPGDYLNFVQNYFKPARTWGIEIIDNSHVAGVTKPTLRMNQYFNVAQKAGGEVFFRAFDRLVYGYGWMTPGTLVDPSQYGTQIASCPVVPYPPENALLTPSTGLNNGCSLTLDNYPGHQEIAPNANGVVVGDGKTIPARPLQLGDVIEISTSFFSTPAAMAAIGDPGNLRYYTNEWTYVMGTGLVPQYGVQPRLMNAPLPASTLSGGLGTVSYDYADNPTFIFQQPQNDVGMQDMARFLIGRRWFHTNMTNGEHTEAGNDVNTAAIGLQGQFFNAHTCFDCHINNGRGEAPTAVNQSVTTMAVFTAALDSNGKQIPDPTYGTAVQMQAQPTSNGVTVNWGTAVRVEGFETQMVTLADGTQVQLSKPDVAFDGPIPAVYSLRSAQPVIGMGLLEAIPDATILAGARSVPDTDGVKGTPNYVFDPETNAVRLGRYGWKASKISIRDQVAGAALQDLSVTSPVFPNRNCMFGPVACKSTAAQTGLTNDELVSITRYVTLLGVPAQRSLASGFPKGVSPLPYLDVNPTQIAAGSTVFANIKCTSCHTPTMQTGTGSELAEVRNQTIHPYTDMLLHDMGPGLADNFTEGQATGSMWRTSPLWGIGYTSYVSGDYPYGPRHGKGVPVGYLHDSRARTLTEAILWHGGEATAAKQRFQALSATDRAALLAFLGSL